MSTNIVGTKNPEHLRENIEAAARGPLPQQTYDEAKRRLDAARYDGEPGPSVGRVSRSARSGMGCWAIGGPHSRQGSPVGWGVVNDDESIRALHRAYDLGVTFFDTADVYGCGHSERLLARAFEGRRDDIVIATKAGYTYVEETREAPGEDGSPDYIRWACEQSLRRLNTDHIDLYQFHLGGYDLAKAADTLAVFDELVDAGQGPRDRLEHRRSGASGARRAASGVRRDPAVVQPVRRQRRRRSPSARSTTWRASCADRWAWDC